MAGSPLKGRENESAQLTMFDEEERDLFGFDSKLRAEHGIVCGIDEAGRGPLAGDLFTAAVIFDEGVFIEGLDDSKKLTEKKREKLYDEICAKARAWCVATASVEEIERINILQADFRAMERAYAGLGMTAGLVIVDGNMLPNIDAPMRSIVKGDAKSASVAAASVLAKVSRDRYMRQMAEKYPHYGFEKNKGYGSKAHYAALDEYGQCDIHRPFFLRKYYAKKAENGQTGKG